MNHYPNLTIKNLVIFYILLFTLYVILPDQLQLLRQVISPLMLLTIVAVFMVSLRNFRRD